MWGEDLRKRKSTRQKPGQLFYLKVKSAAAVMLLSAAFAGLSGCGSEAGPGELLRETLAPPCSVCTDKVQETLGYAFLESQNTPVPHETETTELPAKETRLIILGRRKAYDPRKTPFGSEGTAGRLVIPSAGINVALNLPGEDAQAVTDAEGSACWMETDDDLNAVIGDHVNQDFATLFNVRPGDVCTIFKTGREYRYVCVSTCYGSNIETDVLDSEGHSLFLCGDDRLCMYTCANGWEVVFVTQWQTDGTRPLHQRSSPIGTQIIFMEEDEG